MIYSLGDKHPRLAEDVFVAPDAAVIGDVRIGVGSGVWFGCLIRGDVHYIEIGEHTNIQDHSVIHVTGGKFPTIIGNHCTLGHRVTVHGCTLKDHAFIGIGATVLDDCEIGEYALVAAGSLVTPGKKIPPRMVAMGVPAKVVREITPEEEQMIERTPRKYGELKKQYRTDLRIVQRDP
ncbi:MAG: gamma carbonic anhydrase family protein [Leptospiraceae bacterium]|nr:gamma carbonic anhydrase family protein [Leptospiraceae bacterium]